MSDHDSASGRSPQPESAAPAGAAPAAPASTSASSASSDPTEAPSTAARKRRRGSRGGRGRGTGGANAGGADDATDPGDDSSGAPSSVRSSPKPAQRATTPRQPRPAAAAKPAATPAVVDPRQPEMPDRPSDGKVHSPEVAEAALVRRKPQIGDTMPAPVAPPTAKPAGADAADPARRKRRRGGRGRGAGGGDGGPSQNASPAQPANRGGRGPKPSLTEPVQAMVGGRVELDDETFEKRRGKERKGRPVGRYLMCVQVRPEATQIAVLEGRSLIEHYVSLPQDDVNQIHGNIYLGKVQNVLPGMEAAFVDISTPKNAVLYRGDVQYDAEDVEEKSSGTRIEQMLRNKQLILCQVTKNPIGLKGARLTQEVSLPGRFVVLVPNSRTYGISKRLPDDERKRLRGVLDRVKPAEHGLIVRTAAEGATADELRRDVQRLLHQWQQIDELADRARKAGTPRMLYREPSMAVRVIREEFNKDYRGVIIDDPALYDDVKSYVESVSPEHADRVELFDPASETLPLFERFHIHEQLHKAIERKVWLPSGGSLIIERTEALTVIDVNTGKNVGTSSLEQTVYKNNLEAADEIARQLRLRDIGGIIVIDFIDMEVRSNRDSVVRTFREALARDKTRTQVFDISELGLVEMTRKRIGEGLLESLSHSCAVCEGRGFTFDERLVNPG